MLFHSSVVRFTGDCQGVAEPILSHSLSDFSIGTEVSWLKQQFPLHEGSQQAEHCLPSASWEDAFRNRTAYLLIAASENGRRKKTCVLYFSLLFDKAWSKIKYAACQ